VAPVPRRLLARLGIEAEQPPDLNLYGEVARGPDIGTAFRE
jgi:hypothetical protein